MSLNPKAKRVFVMSAKDHVATELLGRAKYVNLKKLEREIAHSYRPR